MPRVAVVGGGIAGLSAALALQDHGADIVLFEASERFGGPIFTERVNGMIVDAGPDSFLSSKPGGLALVRRLGLEPELINTRADGGGTFILNRGRLKPLPEGITLLVPTQFRAIMSSPLLSPPGKLRLLADYVIPRRAGDGDESVAAFVSRRVGREAFERLAEPLLSGIYAGDARQLSVQATFLRLVEAERRHGSLIKAALAQRRSAGPTKAEALTPFVSLAGGLGGLVDTLVQNLAGADLQLQTAVEALEPRERGVLVSPSIGPGVEVDAVVLATPAGVTARLIRPFLPEAAALLEEIPYVSSATVSMAFRETDLAGRAQGRGFVVPKVEGRTLTALTWSSNKFAGRTPTGLALLRGFVGRAGQEEPAYLPDDQLIELVRSEIAAITGIRAEPGWARAFRWPRAMPQYLVGHPARVAAIEAALRPFPWLALAGSAYRGVGIPDCAGNAQATVGDLLGRLSN